MNLEKIKKVHIIGIGGIGVSAVAKMMLKLGKKVSGSDVNDSEIIQDLKNRGVLIYSKHKKENLSSDVDSVVYSSAVPENNPELLQAKELQIAKNRKFQFANHNSRSINCKLQTASCEPQQSVPQSIRVIGRMKVDSRFPLNNF